MIDVLLPIALMLAGAKIFGEIFERLLKQPAVLGEIVAGVLLGPSILKWVSAHNSSLESVAEIGAVLLLFEVGLECDLEELLKVGKEALWTAVAGVALPFALGYYVCASLGLTTVQSVFMGAALTATSVGITARVFSDLNALQSREARIVLGAAVADDIIGLVILAAVSGFAVKGTLSADLVARTTFFALVFLIGAVVIGIKATPYLLKGARMMQTRAAASSAAVITCLLLSAASAAIGLAPIVGAFAAGIILAKTEDRIHFEEKVRSMADIFVPVFFVLMGVKINLGSINLTVLGLGAALLVVGVIGKMLGGYTIPAKGINRTIVALGMIPRGEVGLMFAGIGLSKKILDEGLYSAIILVVVVTTFLTPLVLKAAVTKAQDAELQAS